MRICASPRMCEFAIFMSVQTHRNKNNKTKIRPKESENINKNSKEFINERMPLCLDLFNKLPYHSLSSDEQKLYWCDGLHFSVKGYKKFGILVFDEIDPWVNYVLSQKIKNKK